MVDVCIAVVIIWKTLLQTVCRFFCFSAVLSLLMAILEMSPRALNVLTSYWMGFIGHLTEIEKRLHKNRSYTRDILMKKGRFFFDSCISYHFFLLIFSSLQSSAVKREGASTPIASASPGARASPSARVTPTSTVEQPTSDLKIMIKLKQQPTNKSSTPQYPSTISPFVFNFLLNVG